MQIVSYGDNLHEMSKPISWEKKEKIFGMSSANLFPSMLSIKYMYHIYPKYWDRLACANRLDPDQMLQNAV